MITVFYFTNSNVRVCVLKFVACVNRSWKLAPQRRSQRHMGGQSNAAAAAALYDHAGGAVPLHPAPAGTAPDAGDAVMARWLQSAGLQHLASPLANTAIDQRLLPNLLMQVLSPSLHLITTLLSSNLKFFPCFRHFLCWTNYSVNSICQIIDGSFVLYCNCNLWNTCTRHDTDTDTHTDASTPLINWENSLFECNHMCWTLAAHLIRGVGVTEVVMPFMFLMSLRNFILCNNDLNWSWSLSTPVFWGI